MPNGRPIKVLIADDHPIFRRGLRDLLESEPGFIVVGEASDGRQALAMMGSLHPDVLLLDLVMPGTSGLDVLREMKPLQPPPITVLVSGLIEPGDITKALQLGAAGVLLKTSATELLAKCLRTVMAGEYWVGRETLGSLVQALTKLEAEQKTPRRRPFGLTARELEVVRLVSTGASNRHIASQLHLSEETVKHHLTNIFEKTGQSTRVELALFAAQHGIVPAD